MEAITPITLKEIFGLCLRLLSRWLDIRFERSNKMKELKDEKLREALDAADNLDPAALVRSIGLSIDQEKKH